MDGPRPTAWTLVATVCLALAVVLSACTHSSMPAQVGSATISQVSLGSGVTVSVAPTQDAATLGLREAPSPPGAANSLTGSAVRALHEPVLVTSTAASLPTGTRLSFTLPAQPAGQGANAVFLASYDPGTHRWTPVASNWNTNRTVISAVVPHFSIWAPLTWVVDRLKATVTGAFKDVFGPLIKHPIGPSCDSTADNFLVHDSVLNDSIQTCVQVEGDHSATVKISNTRAYAIDVLTPSSAVVTTSDTNSVAAQVGALLTATMTKSAGITRTLLAPRAVATITLPLEPGSTSTVATEIDNEAWAVSTLDTALSELSFVYSHLASATFSHPDPSAGDKFIANLLTELTGGKCLARVMTQLNNDQPLTLASAETIGSVVFECISAVAADSAILAAASAAAVIVALGDALVQAIWAGVDTAMSQSRHTIGIERIAAPAPSREVRVTVNAKTDQVRLPGEVSYGETVHVTATGYLQYGYEGQLGCTGYPVTDPDGNRSLNGTRCDPKIDENAPLPTAPIGALLARVGDTGSWQLVGSDGSITATATGAIYFLYNDEYRADDTGGYTLDCLLSG